MKWNPDPVLSKPEVLHCPKTSAFSQELLYYISLFLRQERTDKDRRGEKILFFKKLIFVFLLENTLVDWNYKH